MVFRDILADRVSKYNGIDSLGRDVANWLNSKAGEIMSETSFHLEHVSQVFKEFDNHDARHSEGVLRIIEDLIGNKADELSSYDLFSLIAVSYLHDCGMAVSDYEMQVIKLVEEQFSGQKPVKTDEAKRIISEKLDTIYGPKSNGFDGEIKKWLFVPTNEDALVNYFADLLTDYQTYRNGKSDIIKESQDINKTNDELRMDYLRITHHLRVNKYVKNWAETKFSDFPIPGMGSLLANNIAKCCRAHGEDAEYIKNKFKDLTRVMYYGSETSNLQFVAMMLRLGDIIHFSSDRAHPVLRALRQFKSEYSYQQWHIKSNGVSFNVFNGKISCSAFCGSPNDYYDLWSYVDQIDHELALFNALRSRWGDLSSIEIEDKVDRTNIHHDPAFNPVPGLKFTLNQNKVLDLLMGAKLYTNEYACLRELYQNSLDACRCQIAKDKADGRASTGRIEFGLGEEKRNGKNRKYVYCLDNGKGMTKAIIEKYLLKIGSSYYRSEDFFKNQAETGANFTPTSQFGIGMLSCFMIGDEIEITTHEENSQDGVVSCVMEGPNEYFYYKKPSREDADKVSHFGTFIKVFLNKKYQESLNDDPLDNLAYLLWYRNFRKDSEAVINDEKRWYHHIYQILNDFIIVVPNNIIVDVLVQCQKGGKERIKIYNKPLPVRSELKRYANINPALSDVRISRFEVFKNSDYIDIQVQDHGFEYRRVIIADDRGIGSVNRRQCCVDGIGINNSFSGGSSILSRILQNMSSALNFSGENRPQLSVSRDSIINESLEEYDSDAYPFLRKVMKESIKKVCDYIKDHEISSENKLYARLWDQIINGFDSFPSLLYQCLKDYNPCHEMGIPYSNGCTPLKFADLLVSNEVTIHPAMINYEYFSFKVLLLPRLFDAEHIFCDNEQLVIQGHKGFESQVTDVFDYRRTISTIFVIHPLDYNKYWSEYDCSMPGEVVYVSDKFHTFLSDYKKRDVNNVIWLGDGFNRFDFINNLFGRLNNEFNKNRIRFSKINKSIDFVNDIRIDSRLVNHFAHSLSLTENDNREMNLGLFIHINGCSMLAFFDISKDRVYCLAHPGKCKREELLKEIPSYWNEKINNVFFLDGKIWNPDSTDLSN